MPQPRGTFSTSTGHAREGDGDPGLQSLRRSAILPPLPGRSLSKPGLRRLFESLVLPAWPRGLRGRSTKGRRLEGPEPGMPPGPKLLGGADYARRKQEKYANTPSRFPTDAEIAAEIAGAGWPARCPRCEVDTVVGGWDVLSNQCRECWKAELRTPRSETWLARHVRSDRKHPEEDWCSAIKANGDRCTFDVEIDGYCKVHWRQAVSRREREKQAGGKVH